MTSRQMRQFEMFVRVREFGEARRDRFPEASVAGRAFAAVAASVRQLTDLETSRLAMRCEGPRARAAARAALGDVMRAISRTARVIQADAPDFPSTFRLPDGRSAQALLTAARLVARDFEAAARPFSDHGLPETIVAHVRDLVDAYEQAICGREADKGRSAAARAGVDAAMASGLAAARRLDVVVANQLRDDPASLAEWARDRKVPYRRRRMVPAAEPVRSPGTEAQPSAVTLKAATDIRPEWPTGEAA